MPTTILVLRSSMANAAWSRVYPSDPAHHGTKVFHKSTHAHRRLHDRRAFRIAAVEGPHSLTPNGRRDEKNKGKVVRGRLAERVVTGMADKLANLSQSSLEILTWCVDIYIISYHRFTTALSREKLQRYAYFFAKNQIKQAQGLQNPAPFSTHTPHSKTRSPARPYPDVRHARRSTPRHSAVHRESARADHTPQRPTRRARIREFCG